MRRDRPRLDDPDATIRLPRPGRVRRRGVWLAVLLAAILLGSVAAALVRRPAGLEPAVPPADEAELLAAPTDATRLYRLRAAPSVLVVLFASAHEQALALNRVGAFVEKAGLPHNRVLDDAALDRAIAASGDGFDDYYEGHDYRAADLRRFFDTADRDHVTLRPAEAWLRARLDAADVLREGAQDAVISAPPVSRSPEIDAAGRTTILRHELSHGRYFTDAGYAAYVGRFWDAGLTQADRVAFGLFLARQGYDTGNSELIRNEFQAYLMFTDDPRYFSAASVRMAPAHMAELRDAFVAGMPPGWLVPAPK